MFILFKIYVKNKHIRTSLFESSEIVYIKIDTSKCTMIYLHTYISLLKYGSSGQPHVKF